MREALREHPRVSREREATREARLLVPVRRGLGALYLADERVSLNGITASGWGDRASALDVAQGTAASQPTMVPFAVGARTALRFDGSNDQLSRAIAAAVSPSARGLSVVFVAQGRTGSTGDYPVVVSARPWSAAADAGYAISANGSGASGVVSVHYADGSTGFDHTAAAAQATRGISTSRRQLWCVVLDDTTDKVRFYVNGALDVERTPAAFPTATPAPVEDLRIGMDRAVGTGTRILAMDLYALAIHSEPLRASEVSAYAAAWMPLFGVR